MTPEERDDRERAAEDVHTFRDDLNALTRWGVPPFITDHLAADFNAAAVDLARLRVGVVALPGPILEDPQPGEQLDDYVSRAAVLALLGPDE